MMSVLGPFGVAFIAFVGLVLAMSGVVGVLSASPRREPFLFFASAVCALLGAGVIALLCAGLS